MSAVYYDHTSAPQQIIVQAGSEYSHPLNVPASWVGGIVAGHQYTPSAVGSHSSQSHYSQASAAYSAHHLPQTQPLFSQGRSASNDRAWPPRVPPARTASLASIGPPHSQVYGSSRFIVQPDVPEDVGSIGPEDSISNAGSRRSASHAPSLPGSLHSRRSRSQPSIHHARYAAQAPTQAPLVSRPAAFATAPQSIPPVPSIPPQYAPASSTYVERAVVKIQRSEASLSSHRSGKSHRALPPLASSVEHTVVKTQSSNASLKSTRSGKSHRGAVPSAPPLPSVPPMPMPGEFLWRLPKSKSMASLSKRSKSKSPATQEQGVHNILGQTTNMYFQKGANVTILVQPTVKDEKKEEQVGKKKLIHRILRMP
ncbi:hypothetical protein K488DRAFT_81432 [Vararia minispora EC-137]|uniref:Uncharacterized protein n=1 Tax=Vararia minispora EC-137 TaxID=1314806 RepID=A0ACB8QZ92_9AGAM|nr:hypothetical protein K488DRAFT_81432 [Vararia minispora EC-137]